MWFTYYYFIWFYRYLVIGSIRHIHSFIHSFIHFIEWMKHNQVY